MIRVVYYQAIRPVCLISASVKLVHGSKFYNLLKKHCTTLLSKNDLSLIFLRFALYHEFFPSIPLVSIRAYIVNYWTLNDTMATGKWLLVVASVVIVVFSFSRFYLQDFVCGCVSTVYVSLSSVLFLRWHSDFLEVFHITNKCTKKLSSYNIMIKNKQVKNKHGY